MDRYAWTRPDERDDDDWDRSINDRSYTLIGTQILSHADGLRQTAVVHYHQDVRRSTIALSDERGRVDAEYRYSAYGVVYAAKPGAGSAAGARPRGTDYLYSQSRLDSQTRLSDYGYRDYAPELARFTTVDPIRDGRNWMMFVDGDPVNRVDPDGLEQALVIDGSGTETEPIWPTESRRITSAMFKRHNRGIDIGGTPAGQPEPIVAMVGGIATFAGVPTGNVSVPAGNPLTSGSQSTYLIVRGEDGRTYLYVHTEVAFGEATVPRRVEQGEQIGMMAGNTGFAVHLHLEVFDQHGNRVDPLTIMPPGAIDEDPRPGANLPPNQADVTEEGGRKGE